jgi:tRNA (mo5U34)-methyltransferase
MPTRSVSLLGLRATVFATRQRAGLEFSLPVARLLGMPRIAPPSPAAPAPIPPPADPAGAALAARAGAIAWYHTLDLGHGVVTPGAWDHRPLLGRYRLPERLDGQRVLDVASFDGFWAFEMERRGAAEVVAADIATARELDLAPRTRDRMTEAELDRPFGAGFALAREALGSTVRHVHCNVYDLAPERLGVFDLVHCGDLLLHLRDPALALARIRGVTRGAALISECVFPELDRFDELPLAQYQGGAGDNVWWRFGVTALRAMIADAGFDRVEEVARFRIGPRERPNALWHVVFRAVPPRP